MQTETILIPVKIIADTGETVATSVEVRRTTDADGSKHDELTLHADKADQIAESLRDSGANTVIIAIPDPQDEVKERKMAISAAAAQRLAEGSVNLELNLPHAGLALSAESVRGLENDILFRFVPVKKDDERESIEQRAKKELANLAHASDRNIEAVGRPLQIETNMQGRPVTLVLQVDVASVSSGQFEDLGVYIEHSDGTIELLSGELIPYGESGRLGLRFAVSQFSTFAVVRIEGWGQSRTIGVEHDAVDLRKSFTTRIYKGMPITPLDRTRR